MPVVLAHFERIVEESRWTYHGLLFCIYIESYFLNLPDSTGLSIPRYIYIDLVENITLIGVS